MNDELLGLVPTITDWMWLKEEAQLIEHIYESKNKLKIMPILMCPDDCDLYCTIVVAEVEIVQSNIHWRRIGLNMSKPREVINQNDFHEAGIDWISNMPLFIFNLTDYESLDQIYIRSESSK